MVVEEWKKNGIRSAATLAEEILSTHGYEKKVNLFLGMLYFDLRDYEKAINCFRLTIQGNSKSMMASRGLVVSLFRLGHPDEALGERSRYIENNPDGATDYDEALRDFSHEMDDFIRNCGRT